MNKLNNGKVYIEKKEAFDKFIFDENETTDKSIHSKSSGKSISKSQIIKTNKKNDMVEKESRGKEQTRLIIERAVQIEAEKRENKLNQNLAKLEESKALLDSIDKNLKMHEQSVYNNNRRQFEEWNLNVHGKIQSNIASQIDEMSSKELNMKKRNDYSQFLNISNRKSAIFRDIIIESEYDPLEPNRHSIKARTGILKDPTLMLLRKASEEQAMLGENGKKLNTFKISHGNLKVMLPVEQWASGKIEGTPHGRFMKMMNAKPKLNATMTSNLFFDDYTYPRGKDAVDVEMPKGKRPYPLSIGWDKTTFN